MRYSLYCTFKNISEIEGMESLSALRAVSAIILFSDLTPRIIAERIFSWRGTSKLKPFLSLSLSQMKPRVKIETYLMSGS
jgi:hypothetical protein